MKRITHKDVEAACQRYNKAGIGNIQWADIRGDGTSKRKLYAALASGGVTYSPMNGKTMRETIRNIDLAISMDKFPDYAIIQQAIHERGVTQSIAFSELSRRGLWLNAQQMDMARARKD